MTSYVATDPAVITEEITAFSQDELAAMKARKCAFRKA